LVLDGLGKVQLVLLPPYNLDRRTDHGEAITQADSDPGSATGAAADRQGGEPDNLAGKKPDGKSVREMTAEFNARVPQARKLGLGFWWLKEHVSPFESRAAAIRMIDRLEQAMAAAIAKRRH
jgi:hypothetical protein